MIVWKCALFLSPISNVIWVRKLRVLQSFWSFGATLSCCTPPQESASSARKGLLNLPGYTDIHSPSKSLEFPGQDPTRSKRADGTKQASNGFHSFASFALNIFKCSFGMFLGMAGSTWPVPWCCDLTQQSEQRKHSGLEEFPAKSHKLVAFVPKPAVGLGLTRCPNAAWRVFGFWIRKVKSRKLPAEKQNWRST